MKKKRVFEQLIWYVNAAVIVVITASISGCSTFTDKQTEHCIEQANSTDVHRVNTPDEELNACLENYQLQRDNEMTTGEAIVEDVIFAILDIVTD